jgi:hypothetical protein
MVACGIQGLGSPTRSGNLFTIDTFGIGDCPRVFPLLDYGFNLGLLPPGDYTVALRFIEGGGFTSPGPSMQFTVSAVEQPSYPVAVHPSPLPDTGQPVVVTVTHPTCSPLTAVARGGDLYNGELLDVAFTATECTGPATQTTFSLGVLGPGAKYFRIFDAGGQLIQLEDFHVFPSSGGPPYPVTVTPELRTDQVPVTLTVLHAACPAFSGFHRDGETIDITLPSAECPPLDPARPLITTTFDLGILPAGTYTVRFVAGTPPIPYQTLAFAVFDVDAPALDARGLFLLLITITGAGIFVLRRR